MLQKGLPKTISVVLHPLVMPLFGLIILFNSGTYLAYLPFDFKKSVFLLVAICTFVIPLLFLPLYYFRRVITSVEMNTTQERIVPLIVTAVLYYLAFQLLNGHNIPRALQLFLLGSTLCVLFTLIITFFWKISAHMVGMGGIVGLILALSLILHTDLLLFLMAGILLSGIIGTARLLLGSHTPAQVYAGFFLGMITMIGTMYLF